MFIKDFCNFFMSQRLLRYQGWIVAIYLGIVG